MSSENKRSAETAGLLSPAVESATELIVDSLNGISSAITKGIENSEPPSYTASFDKIVDAIQSSGTCVYDIEQKLDKIAKGLESIASTQHSEFDVGGCIIDAAKQNQRESRKITRGIRRLEQHLFSINDTLLRIAEKMNLFTAEEVKRVHTEQMWEASEESDD